MIDHGDLADLTASACAILLAREAHFPATIADLYDPDAMPENLRHAHERNDEVLERIYQRGGVEPGFSCQILDNCRRCKRKGNEWIRRLT